MGAVFLVNFRGNVHHMSTIEAKRTDKAETEEHDAVIVGAGFAGLYLLDRLRGISVQVFEVGNGAGGVRYWNCYSGGRVNSPGPMYQFSRDELWQDWKWWPRSSLTSGSGALPCTEEAYHERAS